MKWHLALSVDVGILFIAWPMLVSHGKLLSNKCFLLLILNISRLLLEVFVGNEDILLFSYFIV